MQQLIIFTDLDGTLLDHDKYDWSEATPALKKVLEERIPVILNSSKTFSEMKEISHQLGINQPLISENGSVVAIPGDTSSDEYDLEYFALPYSNLIELIHNLRKRYHYKFTGFSDMSTAEICRVTGLEPDAALLAAKREATEPLLWQDTEEKLSEFRALLEKQNLTITRGGRFFHVMSPVNKSQAMNFIVEYFRSHNPTTEWLTMALGDSDNDLAMLESVNYPVLVLNPNSDQPDVKHISNIVITEKPGPTGWNQAVLAVLDNI